MLIEMEKNEKYKRAILLLFAQLNNTDKKVLLGTLNKGIKLSKADTIKLIYPLTVAEIAGIGLISGMNKRELIDSIAASAKLSKADAG